VSAVQQLSRFKLPPGFRGRPAWLVQIWWLVEGSLFRWSPQFMYGWRRWLLRIFGAHVGEGVLIRASVQIVYPWKVTIGSWAWVGDEVVLYSYGPIEIGHDSVISQRSYLCTGSHDYSTPTFDIWAKRIVVEPEAWIGTDVYVGPGVTIGRGAVVGARSSVHRDLPGMQVYVGNPAKPIGPRNRGRR
jgi:putative colanic acid biosynthesis acetyltransferase WcaF